MWYICTSRVIAALKLALHNYIHVIRAIKASRVVLPDCNDQPRPYFLAVEEEIGWGRCAMERYHS